MSVSFIPTFQIIDVIKIKRQSQSLTTNNKQCSVLSCRIIGESLFFYNNNQLIAKRGNVMYIPVGSSYKQQTNGEEIICFHLIANDFNFDRLQLFSNNSPDTICSLFIKAYDLWSNKVPNYQLRCISILYEIIGLTFPVMAVGSKNTSELLAPAIDYINANLFSPNFSITTACSHSYLSRAYFNRVFQDFYHCTPISYVNKRRINRAKQLLLTQSYSNEEICELCGFSDVKYFYTIFKKHTGLTTKQYVKAQQNFI